MDRRAAGGAPTKQEKANNLDQSSSSSASRRMGRHETLRGQMCMFCDGGEQVPCKHLKRRVVERRIRELGDGGPSHQEQEEHNQRSPKEQVVPPRPRSDSKRERGKTSPFEGRTQRSGRVLGQGDKAGGGLSRSRKQRCALGSLKETSSRNA